MSFVCWVQTSDYDKIIAQYLWSACLVIFVTVPKQCVFVFKLTQVANTDYKIPIALYCSLKHKFAIKNPLIRDAPPTLHRSYKYYAKQYWSNLQWWSAFCDVIKGHCWVTRDSAWLRLFVWDMWYLNIYTHTVTCVYLLSQRVKYWYREGLHWF